MSRVRSVTRGRLTRAARTRGLETRPREMTEMKVRKPRMMRMFLTVLPVTEPIRKRRTRF